MKRWHSRRHFALLGVVLATLSSSAWAAPPDTDALRAKHPDYAAALTALGEEQTAQAIEALKKLSASDDLNLAADASFFLGQALLIQERAEDALPVFSGVVDKNEKTTHAAEALYLQGTCQSRLLKRKEAIATWERFLKDYPDAPERMRVDAARQVLQSKLVQDGSISDVQDRMDYARRRLALEDASKPTRDRQEEIVAMLTKLIGEKEKEEESNSDDQEQEQQQSEGSQQGSQSGKSSGSGGRGTSPGGNHQASGDDVSGRTHQATNRGQFGDARDRERQERIYGAMKARFPAQYRKLVEQYSKSLQEEQEQP